jgi:PKD repeat protein
MRIRSVKVMVAAFAVLLTGLVVAVGEVGVVQAAPASVRATASANVNTANPRVTVPTSVQPGDQLVLVATINSAATMTTPAGWTLLGTATDGNPDMRSSVFGRTADAASGGSTVTLPLSAISKTAITLVAYSGAAPAMSAEVALMGATSTTLTTAPVEVAVPDSIVLSYWADKSSGNTGWTLPPTVTSQVTSIGSGGGRITAALGDTVREAGTWPGASATTTTAGRKGIAWTIVVPPGSSALAPTATFSSSCSNRTCTFDASASTDDGTITGYSWDFGDGSTASGVTASRTFAADGTFTVELRVTDDEGAVGTTQASVSVSAPVGMHTRLANDVPRRDVPVISTGEIWDLEYIGDRVFVVGGFTSIRNNTSTNTTTYNQRFVASYNINTGLVDANFRPTFDGGVTEIEASPDGTKLFVVGRFNTVNGVTKRKVASINPVTGATITSFTANANSAATSVAVSNSTVYIGGQFTTINNAQRVGLAAVNSTTGQLLGGFVNNLSGAIGPNGLLTVQAMVLTPDGNRLLVVHTGRQVNGQDRYGAALISTSTNQLLPWRTRLWDDNLSFVGGVQRAYAADIAPNGEYFVVVSGSGGDRPPINDTAMAFPIDGGDFVEPLWISRHSDSIYSVAISDVAVYLGGHFVISPSPTSPDPWFGLTNVGYGNGQGIAGYGLGDDIVTRQQITAVDPATGKALEWNPGGNAFEGYKAMLVMPRGLVVGGDGNIQGGFNTGRVAFYDFNNLPVSGANETTIINPIEGRVKPADVEFVMDGTARAASGVSRVQLEILEGSRYLQDDLVTWSTTWNAINAVLETPGATETAWTLPLTISGNRKMRVLARTFALNGSNDPSKAQKKFESFGLTDQTPTTGISSPAAGVVPTLTFTATGTGADDFGVNSMIYTFRDQNLRYLQDDGTTALEYNTFRGVPDVIGATQATWSYEVTLPYEAEWLMQAFAVDTAGQADLRAATRTWIVNANAVAPTVAITSPAVMNPPTAAAALTRAPGSPITFTGLATDDQGLKNVEVYLRNTSTRENLGADGTWSTTNVADWHRISPIDLPGSSYNWSYTTPFNLSAGTYDFRVRSTDDLGLTTASADQGRLSINVQVPGDNPPNGLLDVTGTVAGLQTLQLDLAGTATDDFGVSEVRVTVRERVTNRYVQANGTLAATYSLLDATLASPGATSTTWTRSVVLPAAGDYDVVAFAYDTAGQQDFSTTGATARYQVFPGNTPPVSVENLFGPAEGAAFDQARIVVTGRFEDDQQMASVQVAIRNSAGFYLNSNTVGTFTTNTTINWRTAFMNSPGSPGSNFSYTSPTIPDGAYTVFVRGVDQLGATTDPVIQRNVTVTGPTNNLPPIASFTVSCVENVCSFDARSSTDENAPTLIYTWNFGNGTGSGPVPTRTYATPGTFNVTLTARDEYGLTATATLPVTITEPAGNVAPTAVINPPSCLLLVCNFSSLGSADPNVGDTITRLWDFGDGGATSTATSLSRTFPADGTYPVTLTVTDGWGRATVATLSVTVASV